MRGLGGFAFPGDPVDDVNALNHAAAVGLRRILSCSALILHYGQTGCERNLGRQSKRFLKWFLIIPSRWFCNRL